MNILGIRYGHSASAALTIDGKIVANVMEERFTRIKNDGSFPVNAIQYCLEVSGITSEQLDAIALPSRFVPEPVFAFFSTKSGDFRVEYRIPHQANKSETKKLSKIPKVPKLPVYIKPWGISEECKIFCVDHHLGHASATFFTSGIQDECLIFTLDGRGDDISTAIWKGIDGQRIEPLRSWAGDSSLGWFYALVTEALDWRHGSDEWKVMGLAPYGEAQPHALDGFHPVFEGGELKKGFPFVGASRWPDHGTNHYHFEAAQAVKDIVVQVGRENIAAETQRISEEQLSEIVLPWISKTGLKKLCLGGGFFLNVKANQRLWETGSLEDQWVYGDPGDSGLPVGVCLYVQQELRPVKMERLRTLYHGPEFSNDEIVTLLEDRGLEYSYVENIEEVTAQLLAKNYIVAWFQGRMEAGPRALGNRSILMSPIDPGAKDLINHKVKFREPFRPFCPSMAEEVAGKYLLNFRDEHFMVTSFEVLPDQKDKIPAVVHVDGTARPQMVTEDRNPRYYKLIKEFEAITGHAVLLNTSFNIKGEPIVCHPREAIKCFYDNGLDVLVLGNLLIKKHYVE